MRFAIPATHLDRCHSSQTITMRTTTLLITLLVPMAHAFTTPIVGVARKYPTTCLAAFTKDALVGKEFQLEEREQQDTELTELWLKEDGTVEFGQTDGPLTDSSWGIWTLLDDGEKPFRMEIVRTYKTCEDRSGAHQVGEFKYEVKREFCGEIKEIGNDIVTVEGVIHGTTNGGTELDCEVGFFSLIDEQAAEKAVSSGY